MLSVYIPRMCLGVTCALHSPPQHQNIQGQCVFPSLRLFSILMQALCLITSPSLTCIFTKDTGRQELGLFNLRESISNYGIPGTLTTKKGDTGGGGGGGRGGGWGVQRCFHSNSNFTIRALEGRTITARAPPVLLSICGWWLRREGNVFGVRPTWAHIPTLTLNCYVVWKSFLTYLASQFPQHW